MYGIADYPNPLGQCIDPFQQACVKLKAYGYTVEAAQDTAQAGLYQTAATDVKQASNIKAMGSLISGAGGVADKWLQYQSNFGTA